MLPTPTIPPKDSSPSSVIVGVSVSVMVFLMLTVFVLVSVTVCLKWRRPKLIVAAKNVAYHSTSLRSKPNSENLPEDYDDVGSAHLPHPPQTTNTTDTSRSVLTSSNVAYGVTQREDMTENVAYGVGQNDTARCEVAEDTPKYDYVITSNDVIVVATPNKAYGVADASIMSINQAYGML